MKKLLLLLAVALCYQYSAAQLPTTSSTNPTSIEIVKIRKPGKPPKGGRSVVIKPTVSVDADMCQLTISMVSDDSYTLYVYDNSGRVVYQESVMTDGGRQVYVLPELEADLYTISIEGPSDTYEGEFFAY